jgi:fructose-bisphosphate aldolase class 1
MVTEGKGILAADESPATMNARLVTAGVPPALVDPALAAWRGEPGRVPDGQRALANRVACNVAALQGSYRPVLAGSYALA